MSEQKNENQFESPQGECPLGGRWHYGNGTLVCGTIRVASLSLDTDPPQETVDQLGEWMAQTLNASADDAAPENPWAGEIPRDKPEQTKYEIEWCQPGDDQTQRWVLMFDDFDEATCIFTDEREARAAFERATAHWSCHLFTSVTRHPRQAVDALAALDELREEITAQQDSHRIAAERLEGYARSNGVEYHRVAFDRLRDWNDVLQTVRRHLTASAVPEWLVESLRIIKRTNPEEGDRLSQSIASECLEALASAPAEQKSDAYLEPLTYAGQAKEGDQIIVRNKDGLQAECVVNVIRPGTDREEIVVSESENRYFLTRLLIEGDSWAKAVFIVRARRQDKGCANPRLTHAEESGC